MRKKAVVQMAIGTLSYSELEAVCKWKIAALGVNYAVYGLKQYLLKLLYYFL